VTVFGGTLDEEQAQERKRAIPSDIRAVRFGLFIF
jgi:hypothetical protein